MFLIVSYMIDKFLNTENASITIEFSNHFHKFLKDNLKDILNLNIKRFNIIVDYKNIDELINILDDFEFDDLPVFIKINNFDFNNKNIDSIKDKYYLIVNSNLDDIKNIDEDIYYEVNITYKEKDKLLKLINNYENIIINVDTNIDDIVNTYDMLNYINSNTTSEYLMFDNMYIPKQLIIDCPYNIYLGDRDYGMMIPRNIYIDDNYIYATTFKCNKFIIGNINSKLIDVYSNVYDTEGYKYFIKCNKILFSSYLNQFPYDYIDYNFMLKEVINNDTSS